MINNYLHLARIVLCGQRWKTPPFTFADEIGMTDSSSFLSHPRGVGLCFQSSKESRQRDGWEYPILTYHTPTHTAQSHPARQPRW